MRECYNASEYASTSVVVKNPRQQWKSKDYCYHSHYFCWFISEWIRELNPRPTSLEVSFRLAIVIWSLPWELAGIEKPAMEYQSCLSVMHKYTYDDEWDSQKWEL